MTPDEREYLCNLVKKRSGLVLSSEKDYLIESRLMPIARRSNLESLGELIRKLRSTASEALANEITEAMTTNESFFFRDKTPFTQFDNIMMPHMLEKRASTRKIRIWCAAASTGQEPYSLAICASEMAAKLSGWKLEIIGTDLSTEVLEKAKAGMYSQFEVQRGLPIQMLMNYFSQVGDMWQINSSIRGMVHYKKLNLLENFQTLGKFDIVFCRNVLIYFDKETKADILNRIAKQLAPDGFLTLGSAETMIGITDAFTPSREHRGMFTLADNAQSDSAGGASMPGISRPSSGPETPGDRPRRNFNFAVGGR